MATRVKAYFNENDRFCCDWLQNLMDAGHITPGRIDDRSIVDLSPGDLVGYDRVHLFAGIGGWDYALALAGWPDDRPVWTGSCPCQPFSSAARGRNVVEDLWPAWRRLIDTCRPAVLFGEQVASSGNWIDRVCDDLEAVDYQVGATIFPACSVGFDHARQRVYFVGYADCDSESERRFDVQMARMYRGRNDTGGLAIAAWVFQSTMALLRAYGNAIVPQQAAVFIQAALDSIELVT